MNYTYCTLDDTSVEITAYIGAEAIVDIPRSIDGKTVTAIGHDAFSFCAAVVAVNIPDSVVSIGDFAFAECPVLSTVTVPSSVTCIRDFAFSNCPSLTNLHIPSSVGDIRPYAFDNVPHIEYQGSAFGAPWGAKSMNNACRYTQDNKLILSPDGTILLSANGNIDSCVIPEGVTLIGAYAFCNCTVLTNVRIPEGVRTIEKHAFDNCAILSEVILPSSISYIQDYAFNDCTSISNLVIPDSVLMLGDGAFQGVPHITYHGHTTGFPWGARSMNTKGKCTDFEYQTTHNDFATITKYTGDSTSVEIPRSLDGKEVTGVGARAFAGGVVITDVVIPNTVLNVAADAFYAAGHITYLGTAVGAPWGAKSIN